MSTAANPATTVADQRYLSLYRFSVEQYHDMIQTGVLSEKDRAELLEGYIVNKIRQSPPYSCTICIIDKWLRDCLPEVWDVRVHSAITTQDSEPEPALAVVVHSETRYMKRHPLAKEVPLIVEVLDSPLQLDKTVEYGIYARARIPVYWIANLLSEKVEVYCKPRGGQHPRYLERRDYSIDESVPLIVAGKLLGEIPVKDLLP